MMGSFQRRVKWWMDACFGPEISADRLERGDRLLEEVFELLQSGDYPRERIRALEEYTYSRPKGEPHQEVGGVTITLAAYCLAHGVDMHQAGEDELARIWTKVDAIRAKQAAKPTSSALPIGPAANVEGIALSKAEIDALFVGKIPTHRSDAYIAAEAAFADYFARNYPGPDTVIFDPAWHAPKIFYAAFRALAAAGTEDGR
ncbi:hypothetical protein [Sinorhizobium meliloti]|uniref:Uncharacterized protein n=1 Tax=Rhizobium meliloti TaxID=382 RepID=A0A2J0Z0A1_RHIML|nr:hypothetical protein [Sinorhizobium meliloti]PJR13943.1 hypothetical protein CEJ86_19565 [Sinorhizobium meliloti]